MSYNLKIMNDGTYTKFCGWTVISEIGNDMKMMENFIKYNDTLLLYFSPLPSFSYHITLYNLWSNKSPLLRQQQDVIDNEKCCDIKEQLEELSRSIGWFNPKKCMQKLFSDIYNTCNLNKWGTITLTIDRVVFSGGTIKLSLKRSKEFDKINKLRNSMIKLCNKDDKLIYHLTLAYKYKDIPKEHLDKVSYQIDILNTLLHNQTIKLLDPGLYSFSSMESYQRYTG
jgi:hypothetical protein